jgi:flagellar assembly protein FliH
LRSEREKVLAEARQQGRDEGRTAGYEEGRKQAEQDQDEAYRQRFGEALALLGTIRERLEGAFSDLEATLAPRMIRLWELVLARLLAREVKLADDPVVPLLREVLLRTSDRERVIIYLNPEDLQEVDRARSVLGDLLRGTEQLDFRGDDHVDRGSCLVETNLGVYDARFRTQLATVAREIDAVLLEGAREESSGVAALLGGRRGS